MNELVTKISLDYPITPINKDMELLYVDETWTVDIVDNVNHPAHYTSDPSGIECIEITRDLTFNVGNAIKYLWRAGLKGNKLEDLQKAKWYIDDEINRIRNIGFFTRVAAGLYAPFATVREKPTGENKLIQAAKYRDGRIKMIFIGLSWCGHWWNVNRLSLYWLNMSSRIIDSIISDEEQP